MTDAWNGRPANPERDGWHWMLMAAWPLAKPTIRYWYSGDQDWSDGVGSAQPVATWRYLGPCLTPAEVAAREQAAWRAGRDAAAAWHDERARIERPISPSSARAEEYAAHAIRALQPPADLAAAAATCDAVAVEALEAIVGMIDGCADVPRAPDSLPQMIAHTAREAIRARGRASA